MNRLNRIKSLLMTIVLLTVMAAFMVPHVASAYTVKQVYMRFSATAGEALVPGNVLSIKDADGKAYKADANDAALRPAVGVAGNKAASGAKVEVVVQGIITGWTTLSEGLPGYLSETAGAVTQSSPAYSQQVGFAISTTSYFFNCQSYVDTSALTALGVLAGATPISMEGATADEFETTIAVTDPTADRTITIPDASGVPILSAAIPEAATACWGTANGIVCEGATANAHETTVAITDPTADRTITIPDATGVADVTCTATHDYAGAAVAWTMTAAEAACSFISVSNANGAVDAVLPAARAGKLWFVTNASGQALTLKVTGQAGQSLANAKSGLYAGTAADVFEIYEEP